MTVCPEALLAMELGMHYACIAIPVDEDENANHEGKTLTVMHELSEEDKLPSLLENILLAAIPFAQDTPRLDENLNGNLIVRDMRRIRNERLRKIGEQIVQKYAA